MSNYWERRFNALQSKDVRKAEQSVAEIERAYNKAIQEVERDLRTWYSRFASNNEIDITEARKFLTAGELEEFKWTLDEYTRAAKASSFDKRYIKQLENASARVHISRLEAIELQLRQKVEGLSAMRDSSLTRLSGGLFEDRYYRTAYETHMGLGIGWDVARLDDRLIERMISKPWASDGINFSERIWRDRDRLVGTLNTELTQSIIRGQAPDEVIKSIAGQFQTSKNVAGRLVMTESAYFASEGQEKAFKDLDVEEYEIVATLDGDTSDLCQSLDGKVYKMRDYKPGVTAPPFHPWCRSTTVPYFEDLGGERIARGEDGETYMVPSDMKYKDWKDKFVDGGSKDGMDPVEQADPQVSVSDMTSTGQVAAAIKDVAGLQGDVNLDGVPLELSKDIHAKYEKVMDRYPQLKGEFKGLGMDESHRNAYGSCYIGTGEVNLNKKYFKDKKTIMREYRKDGTFHPRGTDGLSIVTHELGHAVDGYLAKNGIREGTNFRNYTDASVVIRKRALKELKMTKKSIAHELSGYGAKNDAEFFAEAFAEYMDSPTPRPMAQKVGEIVDELMEMIRKGEVK